MGWLTLWRQRQQLHFCYPLALIQCVCLSKLALASAARSPFCEPIEATPLAHFVSKHTHTTQLARFELQKRQWRSSCLYRRPQLSQTKRKRMRQKSNKGMRSVAHMSKVFAAPNSKHNFKLKKSLLSLVQKYLRLIYLNFVHFIF